MAFVKEAVAVFILIDEFGLFLYFFFFLFVCLLFLVFRDRVFLYSPGCPGAHFVDQAGPKLRNLPASSSQVLGLKGRAPPLPSFSLFFETEFCYVTLTGPYLTIRHA